MKPINETRAKEEIESLDTRSQCRTKLPIFYGSFDNFHHGLLETLMNSNDEISNNFEQGVVEVTLLEDNQTIVVADTGRGIILDGETNGIKNYVLLFETTFAGTNYNNLENGKVTTGTNGCGATVLNYSSEIYEVESFREGKRFKISYKDGGYKQDFTSEKTCKQRHGTTVTFKLDKDVYTNTTFDVEDIKSILNKLSGVSSNVRYILNYKGETFVFHYESTKRYIEDNIVNSLSPLLSFEAKTIVEETTKEQNTIQCLLSTSTQPLQQTFLNCTYLKENGTIYEGIIDGLKRVFNKGVKKNKITNTDIEMSFNFIATIMSTNVEFESQTKFATKKLLYKKIVSDYIVSNMEIVRIEQPKVFEQMMKHLTTINSFNTKNEESRKKVSKALEEKSTNATTRPPKLVPCRSKDPTEVELILIEGDSALNSVKLGRDALTMMVYPLKGKPMNVLKKSIDAILQNQEIVDVFKILGCGITYKGKNVKGFPSFDINKLSVKSILIATDFDEDGYHIQSLLIGILYILAPQLLLEQRVEFIKTPLYIIKQKDKEHYAYNEKERFEILSNLVGVYKETRFKGIGGLPTSVMSKALKHETRESIVVTMEQAKKCADKIELFLSEDILKRKQYIEEHGSKFITESLLV